MPRIRKCAVESCRQPLVNADGSPMSQLAKCCSRACSEKRARAIRAAKKKAADARATPDVYHGLVKPHQAQDVARDVLQEELRPLMREYVEEEVAGTIRGMVDLGKHALAALEEDLSSRDDKIRQRAYELWFRYTVGNPTVAPKRPEDQPQPMQVHFHAPTTAPTAVDATAVETKICVECGTERPDTEFVAGSDRCVPCNDAVQAKITARFPGS